MGGGGGWSDVLCRRSPSRKCGEPHDRALASTLWEELLQPLTNDVEIFRAGRNYSVMAAKGSLHLLHQASDSGILEIVADVEEEWFYVVSVVGRRDQMNGLGAVNSSARCLELNVGEHEFVIEQQPSLLRSSALKSTTGYVLWQVSLYFAEWLLDAANPLASWMCGRQVLEMGSGVGIVAIAMRRAFECSMTATDQGHILKQLRKNVNLNEIDSFKESTVHVVEYDWADPAAFNPLLRQASSDGFDFVLSLDCIYNEAMIASFVDACLNITKLKKETIFVIGQEIRSPDVLHDFLLQFGEHFQIYRITKERLSPPLQKGFVVHVAVLHPP